MLLPAAFLACALSSEQPSLPDLLSRVAEEAAMLQQNAPKSLTREVLEQRALMPGTRFRPRIGKKATAVVPPPRQLVHYAAGAAAINQADAVLGQNGAEGAGGFHKRRVGARPGTAIDADFSDFARVFSFVHGHACATRPWQRQGGGPA